MESKTMTMTREQIRLSYENILLYILLYYFWENDSQWNGYKCDFCPGLNNTEHAPCLDQFIHFSSTGTIISIIYIEIEYREVVS